MQWQDVCEDTLLQDLPYKIELNRWGQIVMSPAKVKHGFFQGRIAHLLDSLTVKGDIITECAIKTEDGTKVADVAWASEQRADLILDEVVASIAPEICIEIISDSNTSEEMTFKRDLYFQAGAKEVWLCDRVGNMTFYNVEQRLERSQLVSSFPQQIKRRNQASS